MSIPIDAENKQLLYNKYLMLNSYLEMLKI